MRRAIDRSTVLQQVRSRPAAGGAQLRNRAIPAACSAASTVRQPPVPSQTMPAPPAQAKGSPLTKILVGFAVVVITVGALAAGGVYYVVYRVKQKVQRSPAMCPAWAPVRTTPVPAAGSWAPSRRWFPVQANSSSGDSGSNGGISGDPCRLLSKDEVGRAIGVEIVATESTDGGCSYLAHGNSGDMTAKHMAAMLGTKGADAKTQQTDSELRRRDGQDVPERRS